MNAVAIAPMILNAKCDIACKYEGFDGGYAAEKKCACVSYLLQSDLLTPKFSPSPLPKSPKKFDDYDF